MIAFPLRQSFLIGRSPTLSHVPFAMMKLRQIATIFGMLFCTICLVANSVLEWSSATTIDQFY